MPQDPTLRWISAHNLVGCAVLSEDYQISDYNEVVRIRTGEGPDVSYEYDSAGRLTAAQAGTRTATVAYDDLDRAVEVGLEGATLAAYDYARADADAALAADRVTSDTPVPSGTSAVFGTMETVVYTRPAPMHFGTDKPSGSLFIPPEYRSVNCFVCTASLESASVSVEESPVIADERFDVLLGAGGTCMIDQGGPQGGGFGAPTGPT